MYLTLYLLAFAALALHAPDVVWQPGAREFFVILGALGVWRYSWGAVHLVRSLIYRRRVFPRLRREADRLGEEALPSHVYIVISSFRIRAETTVRVYQAAIAEAIRYGRPVTIVASLVELADQRLIKRVFQRMAPPPRGPPDVRAAPGDRQAPRHGLLAACGLALPAAGRCRGHGGRRRHAAPARLPFAIAAVPAADAGRRRHHHRRGLRGRQRPGHAGLASPALCPAPSADVVDGAVPPPAGADRTDVDPTAARSRPIRASSRRSRPTTSITGGSAGCSC